MTKRTTIAAISIIVATLLSGCGGGGGDTTVTNTTTATSDNYTTFALCVPLEINPTTFDCKPDCNATEFTVNTYYDADSATCENEGAQWITEYDRDDTPATQEQQDALAYINSIRSSVGLVPFHGNSLLEQATKNHEMYLGDVGDTYNVNMGHYEDNTTYPSAYYTGVAGTDRALYAGYTGFYAGDVITFGDKTPLDSMHELMTAIYHRQALLWNFSHQIGIGGTPNDFAFKAQAHLMGADRSYGFLMAVSTDMAIYPYDGQTGVQRVFYGENPDPLPDLADGTGNPISIDFNSEKVSSVTLASFKLFYDNNDTEITNVRVLDKDTDPNDRFTAYQFALFPLDILDADTTYRVEVDYVADGVDKSKAWRFTTGQ